MRNKFGFGQEFTIEEHELLADWLLKRAAIWPKIELSLNYPNSPEIIGVVEENYSPSPSLFVVKTEGGIVSSDWNGTVVATHASMVEFISFIDNNF